MDWALVVWGFLAAIKWLITKDVAWAIVLVITMVGIGVLDKLDKLSKR